MAPRWRCGLFKIGTPTTSNSSPGSRLGFFALPPELRSEVYTYLFSPDAITLATPHTNYFEIEAPPTPENWQNDCTPFQPSFSSGFTLLSQAPPPTYLLLVCKRLHGEILDHFYATTTVTVGNLNPHADGWRPDPTYEKLRTSPYLSRIRKLDVTVSLDRMRMEMDGWQFAGFVGARYQELDVSDCVAQVQARSDLLVRVLRKGAKDLKVITISWKDDFDGHGEGEWDLKSSVLWPFGALEGVWLRVGEVTCASDRREDLVERLRETLDAICI